MDHSLHVFRAFVGVGYYKEEKGGGQDRRGGTERGRGWLGMDRLTGIIQVDAVDSNDDVTHLQAFFF
jgi:hypothetical protein